MGGWRARWLRDPIFDGVEYRELIGPGRRENLNGHIQNGNASSAILGSSNFTVPGLGLRHSGNNIELNLVIDSDQDRHDLLAWFKGNLGVPSVKETTRQAQSKFTTWTKKPPAERKTRDLINQLESSIDSFRLTLSRTIQKIDDLKAKIESFQNTKNQNPTFGKRAAAALFSGLDGKLPSVQDTPASSADLELVTWLVIMGNKS